MSEQTKTTKSADNDPNSWKNRERGCAWYGENGRVTIHIKGKDGNIIKFIAFPNKFKEEGSKQPDIRIYTDNKDSNPIPAPKKVESKPKPVAKKTVAPAPEENQEEFV